MPELPSGTVTFLFTDIEGSTRLWEQFPEPMRQAHTRHGELIVACIERHGGVFVRTRGEGDSTFSVFSTAADALAAACAFQCAFAVEPWPAETPIRVRAALHTGSAELQDGDYNSTDVNRCARLRATAHGGQTVLSQAVYDLTQERLPSSVTLKDMGLHRLKDLSVPEHIWQMCHPDLPADFPPLNSLTPAITNLPIQMTSFIGREQEMAKVQELLSKAHLLTLTGAGGCGKTRLALQVAADLVDAYPDGVWLVELAALSDPALAPQILTSVLGLREQPGRALTETILDYLKPRTLLLVLDNCEHLLEACARLTDTLLRACPNLKILATSREALNIQGETTFRMPSLIQPDPHALPSEEKDLAPVLLEYDAVRLFVERARTQHSGFALTLHNGPAVAEVCQRLDGIPLAIELAAARVRALSVTQIASRLDDRFRLLTGGSRTAPTRQQTLRATMDWSYDLLTEQERLLLRRLAVFAGGWTLDAAEAVCAGFGGGVGGRGWGVVSAKEGDAGLSLHPTPDTLHPYDVLDLLTSLVDKSLVVFDEGREGEGRYRLLETMRQYGLERLAEAGELDALQERLRDYFLAFAQQTAPKLRGTEEREWLARLEAEYDNFRAVFEQCLKSKDEGRRMKAESDSIQPSSFRLHSSECGLKLAEALWHFWDIRGYLSEGRRWTEALLERCDDAPATLRANSHGTIGRMADWQGDYTAAREHYGQALAIWQEAGDEVSMAIILNNLAITARKEGSLQEARATHEQVLAIRRKLGQTPHLAGSLCNLGIVMRDLGEYEQARALLEEGLEMFRQFREPSALAHLISYLGTVAWHQGDYAKARACFEEGLTRSADLNYRLGIMQHLEGFARTAAAQGQSVRAARLWGAAEMVSETIQVPIPASERAEYERNVAAARSALGEGAFGLAWAQGRAMTQEQAIKYALQQNDE